MESLGFSLGFHLGFPYLFSSHHNQNTSYALMFFFLPLASLFLIYSPSSAFRFLWAIFSVFSLVFVIMLMYTSFYFFSLLFKILNVVPHKKTTHYHLYRQIIKIHIFYHTLHTIYNTI